MISTLGVSGAGEHLSHRRTRNHTGLALSERHRQRHTLAALDDHLLRDIGLTRGAIRTEVSKPFWRV